MPGYLCEGGVYCPHGYDSTHWEEESWDESKRGELPVPPKQEVCPSCGHTMPPQGWCDYCNGVQNEDFLPCCQGYRSHFPSCELSWP